MTDAPAAKLRIDKWLWRARFFKTRGAAAEMANAGQARVNGARVAKASHAVKPGDVLVFPKHPHIRVVEVVALGTRRGPAAEAQALYRDLDPPAPRRRADGPPAFESRAAGSGRPTKKDRRALDALKPKAARD